MEEKKRKSERRRPSKDKYILICEANALSLDYMGKTHDGPSNRISCLESIVANKIFVVSTWLEWKSFW